MLWYLNIVAVVGTSDWLSMSHITSYSFILINDSCFPDNCIVDIFAASDPTISISAAIFEKMSKYELSCNLIG